jgi:hypothetical protein
MQVHYERRSGSDRRQAERPSHTCDRRREALFSYGVGEHGEIFDPYWEPVKGQDDD